MLLQGKKMKAIHWNGSNHLFFKDNRLFYCNLNGKVFSKEEGETGYYSGTLTAFKNALDTGKWIEYVEFTVGSIVYVSTKKFNCFGVVVAVEEEKQQLLAEIEKFNK